MSDPLASKDATLKPAINGHATPPQPSNESGANGTVKRNAPRKRKPNYALIHSKPLPLSTHPLPAFHPTHPISLLRLAYTYLAQLLSPPSSHSETFSGYFSSQSRSVHITDPRHVRALWEMGFFGKGTLSRSEPSWVEREKARIQIRRTGGRTAEEATNARREERRLFKLERARAEREKIERQRLVEEGKLDPAELDTAALEVEEQLVLNTDAVPDIEAVSSEQAPIQTSEAQMPDAAQIRSSTIDKTVPFPRPEHATDNEDEDPLEREIEDQEHLQLTTEEAFFLSYGLGVLTVKVLQDNTDAMSATSISGQNLLELFCRYSFFPPRAGSLAFAPDDQFLLNYVVYHHFRSLGWVVRSGIKFSVDYLLYNRGPVFSHAEFAVLIWPSYSDAYWSTEEGRARRRMEGERDWWWLHCVNRVQSQVRKSLVIVYVDVPAIHGPFDGNIGNLLQRYKVREFVVKRWIANRSRD